MNAPAVNPAPPAALVMPQVEGNCVPLSALRRGATVWGMVGVSESLRKLQERIKCAATSDLSVLIFGETGSGKELVANAVHQESRRCHQRFVAVNTGAIPRELVASELFGHVKGAFTGALKDREGRFVDADGGTLFLDELGTMDSRTQIGLLRALEQRVIQPVGSSREIPVNVRIVAATNCNLLNEVKAGNFREDLYYRLESFVIPVPPLRARREDIPTLAAFFAQKIALEDGRELKGFTPQALHDLCAYDWPGNVRELRNAVAQAVILCNTGIIDTSHLPDKIVSTPEVQHGEAIVIGAPVHPAPLVTVARPEDQPLRSSRASGAQISLSLDAGLDAMVVQIMQKALEVCNGNVTRAAQILGISRKTIYNRLRSDGMGKQCGFSDNDSPNSVPPPPPANVSPLPQQPAAAPFTPPAAPVNSPPAAPGAH
jgi:DNA-binding NtrC family response regulator